MLTAKDVRAAFGAVPYAEELQFEVVEAGGGRAVCALPERPGLLNHLASVHAGALFTFAESVAGAAALSAFDLARFVPMVKDASIDYLRLARGRLTGEAIVADAAALEATADREGKVFFPLAVELKDATGEVITRATFTYRIRKRG